MSQGDGPLPRRVNARAEGRARQTVVGGNVIADAVSFGDQYEAPCTLSPPEVTNIIFDADKRDLPTWVDCSVPQSALLQRIEDEATALVEVVGLGGFGKSSLADWVSEQVRAKGKKVIWVGFSSFSQFSAFAQWVLYKLCVPTNDTMTEDYLTDLLINQLNEKRRLLVMDQLEFIAQTAERPFFETFLDRWRRRGRNSTVLVTTRQRFLPQNDLCLQLSGFTPNEGATFLQKKAVSTTLSDGLQTLSTICNGHPLLLNLSAAWLEKTKENSFDEDGLDFFKKLFKNDLDNPKSQVKEIFEQLLNKLSETLRQVLLEASVYRIPVSLEMAQAMQPEVTTAGLDSLEAQGFFLGQGGQWRLHPLVGDLVSEKRQESGLEADAQDKAIEYFQLQLQQETPNIQDCLECFHHYCESHDYEAAYDVINSCYSWLDRNGNYRILVAVYERLATAWQADFAISQSGREKYGETLNRLGLAYYSQGDYAKAIDFHQQSLEIKRGIGDRNGIANSLNNLGLAYSSQGDYAKAIDFHQQSLEIKRGIGDREGIANSLCNLGSAYYLQGDYAKAIDCQQQSLEIKRGIGDRNGIANSLNGLGIAYYSQGDYAKAIDCQQQSLAITRGIGDRNGIANSLCNLGSAYYSQGNYAKAIDFYQQSLAITREIDDHNGIAASLGNLGSAYCSQGNYVKAIDFQQQSLKITRKIGDQKGTAISLFNLGIAYAKTGEHWQARDSYEQAKKIFVGIGLPHDVEDCDKAIQERNQIISPTPKKAPPLSAKSTEPDWLTKSMPAAPNRATTHPSTSKRPLPKGLPYLAIAAAILLLVLLLQ